MISTSDVIQLSRAFSKLISRPRERHPNGKAERPSSYLATSLAFLLAITRLRFIGRYVSYLGNF